ncbi:MAG: phospholipid methyltransferase, partial [Bacteroidetes bacterium SW_4_67_19]
MLEIGAGAGAFTQALAEKVPGRRLHVVEIDADHERALRAYTSNVYVT